MSLHEVIKSRFAVRRGKLFYNLKRASCPIVNKVIRVDGVAVYTSDAIRYIEDGVTVNPVLDEDKTRKIFKNFTHCCYCGKELPEEERQMQAANHRECWKAKMKEEEEARLKLLQLKKGKHE